MLVQNKPMLLKTNKNNTEGSKNKTGKPDVVKLEKSTGNICVMPFDGGEELTGQTSLFDTFALIIEGKADIVIDKISHTLQTGQGKIIPAHSPIIQTPMTVLK